MASQNHSRASGWVSYNLVMCDKAVASVPRTCTALARRFSLIDLVRRGARAVRGGAIPNSQGVAGDGGDGGGMCAIWFAWLRRMT